MKNQPLQSNKQTGFTLVEMALVLVVIGLILGAVSIGKDLQRSSEYNKVKQKFVDQWEQAYNQYYMRTGVVVGDSLSTPTFAVNAAGEFTKDNQKTTTVSQFLELNTGGDYSQIDEPPRLCQGQNIDQYTQRRENSTENLHSYFDALGIRMPAGRAEGREDRYVYLDTNGNPQEIQVCFQWNKPNSNSGSGNVMVIAGLTPDLARMLDEMIDGQINAAEGRFREQATTPQVSWSFTNKDSQASTTASTASGFTDEAQVKIVTAHYKMNQ
ncbi:type II secretion system protein [Pseudoalteromonas sp. SCSIO 43201]|uniref:type II secretion system protein n=1 Tax=Pseudoalteromonas TaxID=53246 RepID=UPI002075F8D7|nr:MULTISPECIES: type II secretion system protein [Pseudoalteromonas]MDW7549596.1 type II secretion system protein [Pseudoalteromonas peptidolytica]USD29235.1 type II secretion system protein [Pseudoalteromonas sp. SCSIO 43201]